MFVDSSGQVGVGATASTWNLGKSIEIDGTDPIAIWNPGDGFNATSNIYYNSGYKFKTNGGYGLYYQQNTGSGAHIFASTTATGTANGAATFSELARITQDGKLGLGTGSPAAQLQVQTASDTTFAISNSSSVTSGNRGTIAMYNSAVSTVGMIRFAAVTDNVGTEIQFYTRPAAGSVTQSMTLDSSGRLGIGTTSPAEAFTLGSGNAQITSGQLTVG
ncbi:MAG: hypothetical protein EBS18_00360, partial [Actinobacteria bacterium]|nr:hypothetical protein [Actinomycetota bacterium]